VLAILVAGALSLHPAPSALDYARESAEIARIERQDELDAMWAPVRTAVLNIALLVTVVGGLAAAGAWGVAALARFRRERMPRRGDALLPVRALDLPTVAPQALGAWHAAQQLAASHAPVPHTLSYAPHATHSPHYAPRVDYRADRAGAPVLPADEPARRELPGVTDLAALAFRPSLDAILLALVDGGERITVSAKALCHVALVGSTGGGKSNLLRLLLPQLQACGARVVLADPHFTPIDPETGEDWRAIAARLHMAPAISPSEISSLLGYLTDELDRRLELRRVGQRWGPPLFLALDELPVIADTVDGAVDNLGRLLREGRKVSLYSVGASQSMLVKVIGGDSSAREAYRTAFYVGGDLRSATVLLDLAQRDIAEGALGQGVAYLRSAATAPAQLVRVPLATNAAIAGLLGPAEQAPGKPDGSQMEARSEQATRSSIRPEAGRAIELFREGRDLAEIVKELRGIGGNQGRKYQDAAREIQQLIREAL
jgi:hypothetical protein